MNTANTNSAAWNEKQAAEYLGMTISTMRYWRSRGRGPKYIKFPGAQTVRYLQSELDHFLNDNMIDPFAAKSDASKK
jgi:predicted DNA-binding transcriptional regulator AlpA